MTLIALFGRLSSTAALATALMLLLVACAGGDDDQAVTEASPVDAAPATPAPVTEEDESSTATGEATPAGDATPAQDGKPETTELTVGVIPIAGLTPINAAVEEGFFEEEGLDVTLETSAGGAASLPLVAQGDLQISNAPPVSVILGQEQGFDFKILPPALDAKDENPGQTAVVVRTEDGLEGLADLEGKKVAVNTINSVNWLYNRQLLKQAGVDLDSVTYVEVPFPSMIDALLNGSVDAIDVPQPFHHIALENGDTEVLGYTFVDVQPGMHVTAFAASEAWIADNPNTLAAFQRAITRGVEFMEADEEAAREAIVAYTGADAELVAQVPIDSWSTEISIDNIQQTIDLMAEEGLIEEPMDAATIVHEPFSRE